MSVGDGYPLAQPQRGTKATHKKTENRSTKTCVAGIKNSVRPKRRGDRL